MNRLTLFCLFVAVPATFAQDIPLHDIILPGESWKAFEGKAPQPNSAYTVDRSKKMVRSGAGEFSLPLREPTCCVESHGGSTLLVADAADRYVWAFRIEKDGALGPGDRYCRLRIARDDRLRRAWSEGDSRANVTAMTTDSADRTYAASSLGIQVFDPTGRLCGVFMSPASNIASLTFDGNRLFATAGDKVFVREMRANRRPPH